MVGVTVGNDHGRDIAERLRGDATVDKGVVPGVEQQLVALMLEQQARMDVLVYSVLAFRLLGPWWSICGT